VRRHAAPDGDAELNLRRWRNAGGATLSAEACQQKLAGGDVGWDLALDTLFGTGLDRRSPGSSSICPHAQLQRHSRSLRRRPIGAVRRHGTPARRRVLADVTSRSVRPKPGLFVGAGPNHAGQIIIADIGLLDFERAGSPVGQVIDGESCALWIPHGTA
jgi:hypothetical protein